MHVRLIRWIVAVATALAGPFPGPHVDRYIPLAATLFRIDVADASPAYFVITGVLLLVYGAVGYGVAALLVRRRHA